MLPEDGDMSKHESLSDELTEVAQEYAEIGVDQFIDNEILKELPGIKTIIGRSAVLDLLVTSCS